MPAGAADFRLLDKKVVQVLKNMPEKALFLRGLIYWMGFKQFAVSYQVEPRFSGRSSYSLKKMLGLAIAAPIAAGKPKPIVPEPPETKILRFLLKFKF